MRREEEKQWKVWKVLIVHIVLIVSSDSRSSCLEVSGWLFPGIPVELTTCTDFK